MRFKPDENLPAGRDGFPPFIFDRALAVEEL